MKYKALMSNWAIIKDIIIRLQLISSLKDIIDLTRDVFSYESAYYLMIDENGNIR